MYMTSRRVKPQIQRSKHHTNCNRFHKNGNRQFKTTSPPFQFLVLMTTKDKGELVVTGVEVSHMSGNSYND